MNYKSLRRERYQNALARFDFFSIKQQINVPFFDQNVPEHRLNCIFAHIQPKGAFAIRLKQTLSFGFNNILNFSLQNNRLICITIKKASVTFATLAFHHTTSVSI